jgi:hypothetical protein
MRRIIFALLFLIPCKQGAKALIVHKGKSSGDRSMPTPPDQLPFQEGLKLKTGGKKKKRDSIPDFPFMDHVGMVGMGTGIYLGDGYVLTSAHVGCFPFRMGDGSYYKPIYESWHTLKNPDGGKCDLALFKVHPGAPGSSLSRLSSLPIGEAEMGLETVNQDAAPMVMVGTGYTQKDTPTTILGSDLVLGYSMQPKRGKKSGSNSVAEILEKPVPTIGGYKTDCFITKFDANEGEAQAADGDSGGAMFAYNTERAQWELVGCIIAVSQKGKAVPFGCKTFLGKLASYKPQLKGARSNPSDAPAISPPIIADDDKTIPSVKATQPSAASS